MFAYNEIFHLPQCLDMAWWAYTITLYVCYVSHCCGYPVSCILHSSLSCAFITVGTVHVHNGQTYSYLTVLSKTFPGTLTGLSVTKSGQRLLGIQLGCLVLYCRIAYLSLLPCCNTQKYRQVIIAHLQMSHVLLSQVLLLYGPCCVIFCYYNVCMQCMLSLRMRDMSQGLPVCAGIHLDGSLAKTPLTTHSRQTGFLIMAMCSTACEFLSRMYKASQSSAKPTTVYLWWAVSQPKALDSHEKRLVCVNNMFGSTVLLLTE